MYVLLLLALLAGAARLVWRGYVGGRRGRLAAGVSLLLATVGFFAGLSFWGELLWFEALGQSHRLWVMVAARVGTVVLGATVALAGVELLGGRSPERTAMARWLLRGAALLLGALWGLGSWDELMLYLQRVPTGLADPILQRDTGFYLFVLPLLDRVYWLALAITGLGLLALLLPLGARRSDRPLRLWTGSPGASISLPIYVAAAALAAVLAAGKLLNSFHLLYSDWGVVTGAGWTDVHVRLPAYLLVALATLLLGAAPLLPPFRRRLTGLLRRLLAVAVPEEAVLGAVAAAGLGVWLLALFAAPQLAQWLVVSPNEISLEMPYIAHNIEFTRRGFGLNDVEERQFPASDLFTPELLEKSRHLLSETRLWDWRALDAVYEQFQEIRLYYEFSDVDMDRYTIGDRYRQVMVSAREMRQDNLPPQSQTFVNRRFKYTHGYGVTLTSVSDFTPDGLPDMLIKDIPPRSRMPELAVDRPQIYYGELTDGPAFVNSTEPEFDHPSGDQNVYAHYAGRGGVPLRNFWRRFVFGWKFDGTQLLLSGYPRPETRIMFHRQIQERVSTLAPFLELDSDAYIVLVDGRLYWILDAYTTSRYYPYSEPFDSMEVIEYREADRPRRLRARVVPALDGKNYVRNSVKVVVDAFDGTVDLYVFDPEDPLIRAWRGVFPGLFRDAGEMSPGLRAHVRYPTGFLLAQGLVYAKYHMGDPAVFYNQEDLWVRATEKYYAEVRPVEPYYVMWQLPGSVRAEFVLILPFTPKNRQVLIGWIAGMCDGDNYGRFLAYKFPKERRVLGPQQVETKIDQDRFLSGQLTLWDQRGSRVIRGNVLAIPIEDTLLYVEPIYLQAETAAYPELRLVVVMHGDNLSYAETFEEALAGLFDGVPVPRPATPALSESVRDLAQRAGSAFERYLQLQVEQRFQEAAVELETLRETLQQLAGDATAESSARAER